MLQETPNSVLLVTGEVDDLRAFVEFVRSQRSALRADYVVASVDEDRLAYDGVTGVIVSVAGSIASRVIYDLLRWAWEEAVKRGLKAAKPNNPAAIEAPSDNR